ncbi:2253_t:CDS:2 [Entrophospora sp. SA101]|nr:2253_t:CDS:2 [Entrophospora sp. SA101]
MKFIFAFLLFATLSMMVNAIPHQLFKRETQFVQCPALKAGDAAPPQLTVAFIPDPPVAGQTSAFTISGTLSRPVADGDLTGVGFYDPATKSIIGEIVSAPASPTTPFSQELSVPAPAALPAEYLILVMVANPKTEDIIGCAGAMVDACVGDIPIVLMEEKQLDAEVAKAKLDIYRKFHWPPHYKDLSFVIAIAFSGNIVIFNKLTCGKIYVDELHLNLSFVEDRVRCEIEPSSHWGSHITINYSSVLKVFFSINDLEIQRIQNFYVNNNIPFLETAIRNEIKKKVFHLELTPVGLPCSPSDLNTLQVAMYCFVHALLKVHQNGWSVIDLRCPNTIEFNGCYCIIDASEYAIQHEHKFTVSY